MGIVSPGVTKVEVERIIEEKAIAGKHVFSEANGNLLLGSEPELTTAKDVTSVGYGAFGAATTAKYSVAVGYGALGKVKETEHMIAIGYQAMGESTGTGEASDENSYCIAIGTEALYHNEGHANVGIGYRALRENKLGQSNTAVGFGTLQKLGEGIASHTTVNENVAVGMESLGKLLEGAECTALGAEALYTLKEGSGVTAVGNEALYKHEKGPAPGNASEGNTAVGCYAMRESGNNLKLSVAVGAGAMKYYESGEKIVAIGLEALRGKAVGEQATGSSNTAVGYHAAVNITTGAENVAIGDGALGGTTTASNNTAVGHAAMQGGTITGGGNTAIGGEAMNAIESGTANVAVGVEAGGSIKSGARNVLLGYRAGKSLTGGSNIFIGYEAGEGEAAVSNKLLIGNNKTTPIIKGVMSETAANNELVLGTSEGKLGFFGTAAIAKPKTAAPLTVTAKELAEALEKLGLIET